MALSRTAWRRCTRVVATVCIVSMVLVAVVVGRPSYLAAIHRAGNVKTLNPIPYHKRSYVENENWTAAEFFTTKQTIQAGNMITAHDHQSVSSLIDSSFDLDQTGTSGVTLLHLAFFSDNLKAFKLLLDAGVDPDIKLTGPIMRKHHRAFRPGDSILFTTLREGKWDFFFAALPHSSDVNQVDGRHDSLLHASTRFPVVRVITERDLQRIVDAGVDLDLQNRFGSTAAINAFTSTRPTLCLLLLKAGADPGIRDNQGKRIGDYWPSSENLKPLAVLGPIRDQYTLLRSWLNENAQTLPAESRTHFGTPYANDL